jgi:LAGLIDADG endonuclease
MNNNSINKLNPDWVTGFIDAEGCFYVRIAKSKRHKIG